MPLKADIVVIHIAGLRADAVSPESLASDAGLDPDRVLMWNEAFAPSGDARRSLLSVLRGSLVLNLDHAPGSDSLPSVLGSAGWKTTLIGEGELPSGAGIDFDAVVNVQTLGEVPGAVTQALESSDSEPIFLFVHIGSSGGYLHSETTEAHELESDYETLVQELRGAVARVGQALAVRPGPRLVAIAGASGLELGAHPEAPDRPWDDHLRVPLVLGQQNATGLPFGRHGALVQTTDLTPTLLDLMDLRDPAAREGTQRGVEGVSLEPLVHGWVQPPVHDRLFFADIGHAAVRTREWKLITPVSAPWQLRDESTMLYALGEDPSEQFDLVVDRKLGPVGTDLLNRLRQELERPETIGSAP